MEKRFGLSRTVVVLVLTLCCSTVFCATGIYALADEGRTVVIGSTAGIPMILLGVAAWIVPPLFWFRMVEDNEDDAYRG
jgi:predicted phage tail protein